ncbi:hypothetical protein CXF85_15720 [Colwellia sp. 75C3]|uniref:hypothetical protein n=1 Tax=Colwellia sp. 75C3 TaxID=888425 RepID=UPI000C33A803|nr:hypothetical protein [Colwellia sp. 75C3]PKG81981.1 hypothetical protein CXF85_15720 [Colwellia sp. 75C3]
MKVKSYVIGITGHRDFDETGDKRLSAKLSSFLNELKELLPNTPIEIISGMADGADRLLVKEALKKNIAVSAVLPMPEEQYKTDFSTASYQEFKQIITDKNVKVTTLSVANIDLTVAQQQGDERNKLYHALGKYIVEQSNLVVAVWDGINSGFKGGTSDVVLSYLQAKDISAEITNECIDILGENIAVNRSSPSVFWLPVTKHTHDKKSFHQVTKRDNASYLTGLQGPYSIKTQNDMPKSLYREIQELDEYNHQYQTLLSQNKISTEYRLLSGYQEVENNNNAEILKNIDDEFLKADSIALANQKKSDGQFKLFAYMAAMMGLFFLVYAKIVASKFLLIGYLILFLAGWLFFRRSEKSKYFTRHLTARVLAETLRTQFYLTLIKRQNTSKAVDLMATTGVSQFSGASWLKQIVTSVCADKDRQTIGQTDKQKNDNMAFVCQHWVIDQAEYFDKKTEQLSSHHHQLEKIKGLLFIGSGVATISLILFKYQLVDIILFAHVDAKTFTVLLMGLLPFWLAVWELYQNKMAIKELLWQYRNQSLVFNQAQQQLQNATTLEQKSDILADLAHHSMMENYIWIIHRYHREHEPPTAG